MALPLDIETRSPEETQQVGQVLGGLCTGGERFFLVGPLGAGKTCFVPGLAWGLGYHEHAHSPTFVMMTEYQGRLTLYHFDLYRTESIQEALDLGIEEYLTGGGVCAIEWADRALPELEREGMLVELAYLDGQRRRLSLTPWGARYDAMLAALQAGRGGTGA